MKIKLYKHTYMDEEGIISEDSWSSQDLSDYSGDELIKQEIKYENIDSKKYKLAKKRLGVK